MKRVAGISAAALAIGVMSLSVGGIGVAVAANGGSLTLGQANHATKTTTLANAHGTPLTLHAAPGKPPLSVSSDTEVTHLNASTVGGSGASALQTSGASTAETYASGEVANILATPAILAASKPVPAGIYYATATFQVTQLMGTTTYCELSTQDVAGSLVPAPDTEGDYPGTISLTITKPLKVGLTHEVVAYCWSVSEGHNPSYLRASALSVIPVGHASSGATIPGHTIFLARRGHQTRGSKR